MWVCVGGGDEIVTLGGRGFTIRVGVWQRMSELAHLHEQSMNQVHLPEEKTGLDVIQSYPRHMMHAFQPVPSHISCTGVKIVCRLCTLQFLPTTSVISLFPAAPPPPAFSLLVESLVHNHLWMMSGKSA